MRKFLEKLFPSLGKKIAFAVSIVFFIAGGAFVYFAHRTGYSMLEKGAQAKAHGVVEFGRSIIEYAMLEGRNNQLQAILDRAVTSNQADDILILDRDGRVILRARTDHQNEILPLGQFSNVPDFPGEKFLFVKENNSLYEYFITPIIKRPDCFRCHTEPDTTKGFLAVKISMDDIRSVALQHRTTNILMTILVFTGLGGVILVTLLFLVIRPVRKLRNQIIQVEKQLDHFEQGEKVRFDELTVPQSQDEIAGLLRAFNKLIRRLNEAHAKLYTVHNNQLEQADRLATAGEMAASMAHEIKNPITGVLGALQVFDGETADDDPRKEILAEMMVQLDRVNQAVNDLLSYARPALPIFEDISLNDLIQRSISLLFQQTKKKQIVFQTQLSTMEVVISADKKQIQQVIWNIMLNAIQAMETGGTLSISTYLVDSLITIQISDAGKGIPPDQLDQVFKPFYTTKHKGTGLGMTISRRIVEQHNGKIEITSEVGKGTIVTISLPSKQV